MSVKKNNPLLDFMEAGRAIRSSPNFDAILRQLVVSIPPERRTFFRSGNMCADLYTDLFDILSLGIPAV